jgi:enoyl-CoA hydratase/carnithine racemase
VNKHSAVMAPSLPLVSTLEDGVLRLVLSRPERRNCLSEATIAALKGAIAEAGSDEAVRVVVIAAEGPVFSSGHDLKELIAHKQDEDGGEAYFTWLMEHCGSMMQSVVNCPKPVIAEVSGIATAAGCQLVASCDLAVAADDARFSTPGVNIGLFCSTPMIPLSRNVAPKHAMEMLLTGDFISAQDAMRMGLVNRVVPSAELTAETMALARKIASKSAATIALGKAAFYRQRTMPLDEAYAYCSKVMIENMKMYDANEGICAFIEKRPAQWKDR